MRLPIPICLATGAILGLLARCPAVGAGPVAADVVFRGGTVIDGTGDPRFAADVAIRGDRIVAVGSFEVAPGAKVIDATGLVVAPGFIDLHTHSDGPILDPRTRGNLNYLKQGVTTIVTGNCGDGAIGAREYLAKIDTQHAGTNVAHLVPQGSVRKAVLGNSDRKANPSQLARMKAIVARDMDAGAWGLSTGLVYVPSRYADTEELVALAEVVAERGGLYASHIRDEEAGLLESIDEAIAIGGRARLRVHISHLKASGRENWGMVGPACARIEAARQAGQTVTADQYPYPASSMPLSAMVIPDWARRGNASEFARIAADPGRGPELRLAIARQLSRRDEGATIRLSGYPPDPTRVGSDLLTIAQREGTSPLEVVLDVGRHGGAMAIDFGQSEQDIRNVMARPYVATASDASAHAPGGLDKPHPRAYGTFPRKVRYALDEQVLTLERAIRSATGLPAEILGLSGRGVLRPGAFADVVAFDPATFRDLATFDEPTRYARGVHHLLVNGVAVLVRGKYQHKLAGRALRRQDEGPADLIVRVGRIWTGDPENPRAEALAARGGKLVAVGAAGDVLRYQGPRTAMIERPGEFATPGLVDAHGHMISLGTSGEELDLRGSTSAEDAAGRVARRIAQDVGDGWITGRGWDQSRWPGGAFPDAATLDRVAPGRPVYLRRVDGHAGWANSEAMRRAGLTAETAEPPGGQILRDRDGRPTGVLIDAAANLIARVVPRPTPADLRRRILKAQDRALRAGLTGVHDAGLSHSEIEVYRDLDRQGALKIRVYGMAQPRVGRENPFLARAPEPGGPNSRFELRAIKLFADGALGSRGALLFEPYADASDARGLMLIDPKALEAIATQALRHGWQVCTHAIGDRGNALVLDAYAAARAAVPEARDPRLRVEHAQVLRKADVARFAELGAIASMQPSHVGDDLRWAEQRLGPARAEGAYAWRWLLDARVPLAFGSDFPVEELSPFEGLYTAVTRQDDAGQPPGGWHPEQRINAEDALRGYTSGAAFAGFAEDRLGVLKVGMRADLTVIDRDLLTVEPGEIRKARATVTIIDGEAVYQAEVPPAAP